MERRSFLVGGLAVTALAITSSQAEALNISTNDLYINSFIRQNPDLKNSVLDMVRTDGVAETKKTISAFYEFQDLIKSDGETFSSYHEIAPQWRKCVMVPKSAVVAVGWYYKVVGGVLNLAAIPVASTVAGVPIAVILAALGIGSGWGGDAILSWADKQRWPKRVCVEVS